ncbi:MAG: hypothetical protein CSA58_12445 [Micrococcales bacterium]|nr:MAG: hypothetical protein CSB46_09645 [Micrococcales bacterium]PIE25874.1 MAG: hypothetical protein CSA58_12445 [Micrococcales bacterium]
MTSPPGTVPGPTSSARCHGPDAGDAPDELEVYVWVPDGVKAMTCSGTAPEKRFGCHATARNWNTGQEIIAKP